MQVRPTVVGSTVGEADSKVRPTGSGVLASYDAYVPQRAGGQTARDRRNAAYNDDLSFCGSHTSGGIVGCRCSHVVASKTLENVR